jgi:nicotinic acid phosphoribosyltransferase
MNTYGIMTETNCITKKEYVPCGTAYWIRLDGRKSTNNLVQDAIEHFQKMGKKPLRVIVARGALNREKGLKVLACHPFGKPEAINNLINY